uniref:peptidylprolyl isomerase n=1 Tax=Melianthus villosus TaxID=377280 RepID=A0A0F7CZ30_9ROSI
MTSSSPWSPLLPIGHLYRKCGVSNIQACSSYRVRGLVLGCQMRVKHRECDANKLRILRRRDLFGIVFSVSSFLVHSIDAHGAGLPSEEKPKLCDDNCEKELENVPMVTTESGLQYKDIKVGVGPSPPIGFQVAANYIAMVPSGQIFDSSLEKGQVYIFRVGSGQVVKGLDEGILSMKVGGKRRIYIPGPLAFPKGLTSAPGRPRVAANSPVIFDVTLEYIPGLEVDEE